MHVARAQTRDGDGARRPSLFELVEWLARDIGRLLDQTWRLFRLEVRSQLAIFGRTVALLAAGGVLAVIGVFLLILALALGMAEWLNSPAGGFALTGGIFAAVGAGLAIVMVRRVARQRFVPEETVAELRRDVAWIKSGT